MTNEINPQPPQAQPAQKSSGCLPFFLGCFTSFIVMILLVAGLSFAMFYAAEKFIDKKIPQVYVSAVRPAILQNFPGTEDQKQAFLSDLDELMRQYPSMDFTQKKKAIADLITKWQGSLEDYNLKITGSRTTRTRSGASPRSEDNKAK